MTIYKLIGSAVLTLIVIVGLPLVAARFGWMAPLAHNVWVILVVATLGLLVKSLIGDWVAGEFLFYKFGYDNCVMTFGALLTAFCLQILSPGKDLFSGMDAVIGFRSIPKVLSDASMNRCIQLLVFLLVALLTTLLTGRIAAEIKAKRAKGESFLAFMSTLIGLSELSLYVLILVSKG